MDRGQLHAVLAVIREQPYQRALASRFKFLKWQLGVKTTLTCVCRTCEKQRSCNHEVDQIARRGLVGFLLQLDGGSWRQPHASIRWGGAGTAKRPSEYGSRERAVQFGGKAACKEGF